MYNYSVFSSQLSKSLHIAARSMPEGEIEAHHQLYGSQLFRHGLHKSPGVLRCKRFGEWLFYQNVYARGGNQGTSLLGTGQQSHWSSQSFEGMGMKGEDSALPLGRA
jgi:hypothetical protein